MVTEGAARRGCSSRCSWKRCPESPHRMAARSSRLRSSRTLPGQSCAVSKAAASRVSSAVGRPRGPTDVVQKRRRQLQDVGAPFTQRRQLDVEHLQAIEQVLAEGPVFDRLAQVGDLSRQSPARSPSRFACRRAAGTRAPAAPSGTSPAPPGSSRSPRRGTAPRPRRARFGQVWQGVRLVNAPRSYPNSSDSSSVSGSAAQLRAMNGPCLRGELRWMNRATTSLPGPDSPCNKVVASDAAPPASPFSRRRATPPSGR